MNRDHDPLAELRAELRKKMSPDPLAELRNWKAAMEKEVALEKSAGVARPAAAYAPDETATPMHEALARLQIAVDDLGGALETLGARLRPVMYEFVDEEAVDQEAVDDSHSYFTGRMTRLRWQVEALRAVVSNFTRRLEI